MKIRLALIVLLITVMITATSFATTTLTTIFPQKQQTLIVGNQAPTTNNVVEVVNGDVNVSGTDIISGNPACYKIGGNQVLGVSSTGNNILLGQTGNVIGLQNCFYGNNAGLNGIGGNYNVVMGVDAFEGVSGNSNGGSSNIFIGTFAGSNCTGGSNNVVLGSSAGVNVGNGSYNVYIGNQAGYTDPSNYKLYIQSQQYTTQWPLIYGTFSTSSQMTPPNQVAGVAINAGSCNGLTFYVSGTAGNGSGQFSTTGSDIRWKKNITTLDNPIDKILKLRGVMFDWRRKEFKERHFPAGRQIGIIAQEAEKEFPELVTSDGLGYKNFAYEKFTAVLLEAVKAQQKEIQALKVEVEKLKKPAN